MHLYKFLQLLGNDAFVLDVVLHHLPGGQALQCQIGQRRHNIAHSHPADELHGRLPFAVTAVDVCARPQQGFEDLQPAGPVVGRGLQVVSGYVQGTVPLHIDRVHRRPNLHEKLHNVVRREIAHRVTSNVGRFFGAGQVQGGEALRAPGVQVDEVVHHLFEQVLLLRGQLGLQPTHEAENVHDDHQQAVEVGHVAVGRAVLLQDRVSFLQLDDGPHQDLHDVLEADGVGRARPPLGRHEREELGERQEAALRHRVERVEHALLHVERVHPQRDAALEVAHVGVERAAVPDVVGRVRVGGAQDPLPDEERLHAHVVRVGDQVVELVERGHLDGVFVGGGQRPGRGFRQGVVLVAVALLHRQPPHADGAQHVALLVDVRGPEELQPVGLLHLAALGPAYEELDDLREARYGRGKQWGHSVRVPLHHCSAVQQQDHDVEAARLRAVVESCVTWGK